MVRLVDTDFRSTALHCGIHWPASAPRSEVENIVAVVLVVAAGEFLDVDHVPLQAEAERAATNRPLRERRAAEAVVVECGVVISEQERFHRLRSGVPDHQFKGVDAKQQSRRAAACR